VTPSASAGSLADSSCASSGVRRSSASRRITHGVVIASWSSAQLICAACVRQDVRRCGNQRRARSPGTIGVPDRPRRSLDQVAQTVQGGRVRLLVARQNDDRASGGARRASIGQDTGGGGPPPRTHSYTDFISVAILGQLNDCSIHRRLRRLIATRCCPQVHRRFQGCGEIPPDS
jgi:hypothetical protein